MRSSRLLFIFSVVSMLLLATTNLLNAGLVAHWALDDYATNNIITDSSGNGYHGVLGIGKVGALTPVNTDSRSAEGVFGNYLDLFGDAFVDLTSHIASLKPTGDYTLAMWVKNQGDVLSGELTHTVFAWGVEDPYYPRIQFDVGFVREPNQVGYFYSDATDGGGYMSTSEVAWTAESWHHVAVTVEREDVDTVWCTLYQDGIELAKTDTMSKMYSYWGSGLDTIDTQTVAMHSVLNQVTLGGVDYGSLASPNGQYANLALDDVGFWDIALDSEQINRVMGYGVANWAGPILPGDANTDGYVNAEDASILACNWLSGPNASWGQGDFDGDGYVNDVDATMLATNWSSSTEAVPEPSVFVLLAGALAGLLVSLRKPCVSRGISQRKHELCN